MRLIAPVLGSLLFAMPVYAQTAPAAPAPVSPAPVAPAPASPAPMPAQKKPPAQKRAAFEQRFDTANTTHDGRLTLAQAQAAKLHNLVRNFQAIDRGGKGYVTKEDVHAYMHARKTQQAPL